VASDTRDRWQTKYERSIWLRVRVLTGAVARVRSIRHYRDERLIKRATKVSLLLRLGDVIRRAAAALPHSRTPDHATTNISGKFRSVNTLVL
jgi:hypothetical protein